MNAIQLAQLARAYQETVNETAVELPPDATQIQEVAVVAVSSGFAVSTGQFFRAMQLKPISTLILFVAFTGGSGVVLPKQA